MNPVRFLFFVVFLITNVNIYSQDVVGGKLSSSFPKRRYPYKVRYSDFGINRKIKSLKVTAYVTKEMFGERVKDGINSIDEYFFDENGVIIAWDTHEYDYYGTKDQRSRSAHYNYHYDETGKLTHAKGDLWTYSYEYDSNHRLLSVSQTCEKKYVSEISRNIHNFIDMGNGIVLFWKWMLNYTGNTCVEKEYGIHNEQSEHQYTTTYRNGNIVLQQVPTYWKHLWEYRNSKVAWEALVDRFDNVMEKDKRYFYYNQKGLFSSSTMGSYVYTYDNYGNWVTRKRNDGDDIVEREYVYY